jgi:predicted HTH transcriptional regulator
LLFPLKSEVYKAKPPPGGQAQWPLLPPRRNQTLRQRFNIADENAAMVSRTIKDTLEAGLIKEVDPGNKSREYVKYRPNWA